MSKLGMSLAALALWSGAAFGGGTAENPDEVLTKTFDLGQVRTLDVRGQITFELVPAAPGTKATVTVETTRALFGQLSVSNWWGWATVSIESGLQGPRENGEVKAVVALPPIETLTVSDHSHGSGTWGGAKATVSVGDFSSLSLHFEGDELKLDVSWFSTVTLTGRADRLSTHMKSLSKVDASALSSGHADIESDKTSEYAPPADAGS